MEIFFKKQLEVMRTHSSTVQCAYVSVAEPVLFCAGYGILKYLQLRFSA